MISLLEARIFHSRLRPRKNRFRYGALYFVVPVSALAAPRRQGLFSIDRANLFSIRTSDFGDGSTPPEEWIGKVLADWQVHEADGDVWLMTLPRVLGYAFNPVSFWFCFDRQQRLRAVLAEVNNTFGERHSYLCFREDHCLIESCDVLQSRKAFHVSPFMEVDGEYRFRFCVSPERISVAIDHSDKDGPLLKTSVAGDMQRLSSMRLLRALLGNPLHPLKVIGLIHYQAAKLFLKGVRHFGKPVPPTIAISH